MTNALWLREGSSVLQLIPYGWRNKSGFVLGEDIFRRLAEHKRCAYFMWENRHANMSWLNHVSAFQLTHDQPCSLMFGPAGPASSSSWTGVLTTQQNVPVLTDLNRLTCQ